MVATVTVLTKACTYNWSFYRWLPQTTCAGCAAGSSGDFLTPSPPAEQATTCQYKAGQPCTGDGTWNGNTISSEYEIQVVVAESRIRERLIIPRYEGPHRY